MVKMKYCVKMKDSTMFKVSYFASTREASVVAEELSHLLQGMYNRGLILDFRIEESCR